MSRKNFPKSVMVACIKRATINDVVFCEECHTMAKRFQIDHVNPDGLTGEPTLENARLLCVPCHSEKTKQDVANIARAKRREVRDLGAHKPAGTIKSAGFSKSAKPPKVSRHNQLPPRNMYEDAR